MALPMSLRIPNTMPGDDGDGDGDDDDGDGDDDDGDGDGDGFKTPGLLQGRTQ